MKRKSSRPANKSNVDHLGSAKSKPTQSTISSQRPAHEFAKFLQSPWLLGFVLIAATIFAYQPAWHAGFIWDDDQYVTNNPLLTAPDGLWRIWFSTDSPSQYFPLTYTVFRIEHALWGFNSTGYHWANILLHAVNALLVWRLLKQLNIPGAWLAAAIFALHPIQVEAVAWISELKSILSLLFFLLALLCWIEFIEGRPKRWYALSLIFFALALFAKTTACPLPAALLLVLWIGHKPITRLRLFQIVPFVAVGIGIGLLTIWWERYHIGTQGEVFSMTLPERIIVASHAIWFYAGKLLWPANLIFCYPKWDIHSSDPLAYGWLAGLAAAAVVICFARRFVGRSVETATLFYVTALSPILGFVVFFTFRYTFVADHYQYIASIGLIALASTGITIGLEKIKPVFKPFVSGTLLLTLGILTWKQCLMYADQGTLWQATIQKVPNSWMAYNNLGFFFYQTGQVDKAIPCWQKAIEILPENYEAYNDLGLVLVKQGQIDEGITNYLKSLEINPDNIAVQNNLGSVLLQKGEVDEAIIHFQKALELQPKVDAAEIHYNLACALLQRHRISEAIIHFQKASEIQPDFYMADTQLAWIMAASPTASIRNGSKALELARRANQLSGGENSVILSVLAGAYAECGQFSDAIATGQKAFQLANAQNNGSLAGVIQNQIKFYQAQTPLRDNSLSDEQKQP